MGQLNIHEKEQICVAPGVGQQVHYVLAITKELHCKVLTLHGLLTHATCHMHVHVHGTGVTQLYIQLGSWQYSTLKFSAGVWVSYKHKHYNWFWE